MFDWVLLEFLEGVPSYRECVGNSFRVMSSFFVVCELFKWRSHDVGFHSDKSLCLGTTYIMSM